MKIVDKNVTKHDMQYREEIADVPSVLNQEHLVEAVEVMHVEAITRVMNPRFRSSRSRYRR